MVETQAATEKRDGEDSLTSPGPLSDRRATAHDAVVPAPPAPHPASLFRGRGEYSIDDKGRLTLPSGMRPQLVHGGNLVVLDGRCVIWDEATYRRAVDQLNALAADQQLTTTDVRSFLANTHAVSLDGQGRVVVPPAVRIEAGLEREVLVLGAGSRIEILPVGADALEETVAVSDDVVAALDRAQL